MIYIGIFGKLPTVSELKSIENPIASTIYGSNNQVIDHFYIQNRSNIDSTEISDDFLNALVATEDVRFYKHHGIDLRSLGRVLVKSILMGNKRSGGGSTITQQLAKNLYGRRKHFLLSSPVNKIREMLIAKRMEHVYSKKEILMLYLNTVSFGENLYGIEKAAYRFYNKKPKNLSLDECAILVGVLKAPSFYNPRLNPEKSLERRNVVLGQMNKYGFISDEIFQKANSKPVALNYQLLKVNVGTAEYYKTYLRKEFETWAEKNSKSDGSKYNIDADGLKIYTTVHPAIQFSAEKALKGHISRIQPLFRNNNWDAKSTSGGKDSLIVKLMLQDPWAKSQYTKGRDINEIIQAFEARKIYELYSIEGTSEHDISRRDSIIHYLTALHGSVLAMDPQTGGIMAYVGGADYGFSQYDQVLIPKQVGSTFKPIAYLAGLEEGIKPCDYFDNVLTTYPQYEGWTPRNSDSEYGGSYSLHGALAESVNTVSVQVILKAGIRKVVQLAKKMGISAELTPVPSLVLGTSEVSLMEMVRAYSGISNGGFAIKPYSIRRIESEDGKVLFQQSGLLGKSFASEQNVKDIQLMMSEATQGGTGESMRFYSSGYNIIGKTGTTQNQSDGWYIGSLPNICVGSWVGTLDKRIHFKSLSLGSGASTALPIVGRVFADLALWRTPIITNFNFESPSFSCPKYSALTAEEAMNMTYSDTIYVHTPTVIDTSHHPDSIKQMTKDTINKDLF